MKKKLSYFILLFFLFACRHQSSKSEAPPGDSKKESKSVSKPPTIFSDTLTIDSRAAVFYYPDSIQLKKIRAGLDSSVFEAVMHEYFYQFKYVHNGLDNFRPNIKIVEAKNVRYLLFIKANKSKEIIDLDTKYDPYGLFVFDPQKNPSQLELTNAPSEIAFYFSTDKSLKNR